MSNLKYCEKCDRSYIAEDGHNCPNEARSSLAQLLSAPRNGNRERARRILQKDKLLRVAKV